MIDGKTVSQQVMYEILNILYCKAEFDLKEKWYLLLIVYNL